MGRQHTAPNPMVGAVIVKGNKIIGEGYHKRYGGPHAEVVAVNSVGNKSILSGSTMYVSLEPCCHYGKTPPCTSLIISSGISEVYIATVDPNPEVSGNGIKILQDAGIKVHSGILEEEAKKLNLRFNTFHIHQRPYIILKWAQSADGFIDIIRTEGKKGISWISNQYSKQIVHKWRSEEAAILIGTNTAINDNPMLTTREWSGKSPLRLLIDRNFRTPFNASIFSDDAETWCFYDRKLEIPEDFPKHAKAKSLDFSENIIPEILTLLYRRGINSMIVEGGKFTLEMFIKSELWDEARVISGKIRFGDGIVAPSLKATIIKQERLLDDIITYYKR